MALDEASCESQQSVWADFRPGCQIIGLCYCPSSEHSTEGCEMETYVSCYRKILLGKSVDDTREGAFQLMLATVSSKMRLQIKQGGKVHVSSQLR
jgi:hypothetical protein